MKKNMKNWPNGTKVTVKWRDFPFNGEVGKIINFLGFEKESKSNMYSVLFVDDSEHMTNEDKTFAFLESKLEQA